VPGAFIVALNTAYPAVHPDLWIGLDDPSCYERTLWHESFMKITGRRMEHATCGDQYIRYAPRTYLADVERAGLEDVFTRQGDDVLFLGNQNSFIFALHVILWLGAKRIHLVGCDLSNDKADYHDGYKLDEKYHKNNASLYASIVDSLREIAKYGEKYGVEFISCTPESKANDFLKYVPIDRALSRTKQPSLYDTRMHCSKLLQCRWKGRRPKFDRGIVVTVDGSQQDMLPWWYENLTKHNDYPIVFMDFGMSDEVKDWCSLVGTVVHPKDMPGIKGWFRKPFALLHSPFRQTMYLELDCEVRGYLKPLFDGANDGHLVISEDRCYPKYLKERMGKYKNIRMFNGGLVVYNFGDPLMEEWARLTLARHESIRGDQEILSIVLNAHPSRVRCIPPSLFTLRLEEGNEKSMVKHWTGPQGKAHIRSEMAMSAGL